MLIYMHMLATVWGGSVSSAMRRTKDQIGIQMQFLGDGQVVFTDQVDGLKWVSSYQVQVYIPITSSVLPLVQSNNLNPRDGLLHALLMNASRY